MNIDSCKYCHIPSYEGTTVSQFAMLNHMDAKELITSSPTKTSPQDPIPTQLLKVYVDTFTPLITTIVNTSISTGIFPKIWKGAFVTLLLKKEGLEQIPRNFRPISNLNFVSKILEKSVMNQFMKHCSSHSLQSKHNSAYKPYHSTETILLKISSDVFNNMDKQEVTILCLLDLSAAFDSTDYGNFFSLLHNRFGLDQKALDWFKSYLTSKWQQITVNSALSEKQWLTCGVPKAAVQDCCAFWPTSLHCMTPWLSMT